MMTSAKLALCLLVAAASVAIAANFGKFGYLKTRTSPADAGSDAGVDAFDAGMGEAGK